MTEKRKWSEIEYFLVRKCIRAAAVLLLLLGKEIVLLDLNDSNVSLARVGPQLRDDPLVFPCEEVREDKEAAEEDAQYQYLRKVIK